MRFRYLGDHEIMVAFGYDFSDGDAPDVIDPHAIQKLTGNSHFEMVDDAPEEPVRTKGKPGRKSKAPTVMG